MPEIIKKIKRGSGGKLVILAIALIIGYLAFNVSLIQAEDNQFNSKKRHTGEVNNISQNIEDYDISPYFYFEESGKSSWYGRKFHNRKTASGERYNMYDYTAAHRKLPFGTLIRLVKEEDNKTVLLRVNDRGPFIKSRIIDMSKAAADELDAKGVADIRIEALVPNEISEYLKDDTYYFGYSYDLPLVCIPSSVVSINESSSSLSEAISLFQITKAENPGKLVYIFTKAIKEKRKMISTEDRYFVGMFSPEQKFLKNNEIVENK